MHDKKLQKERVTIFGDDWKEDSRKRHGDGIAGTIFITAGIVLLFNTLNIISWDVWDTILKFWPLLLIFWGIQIIFGGSTFPRAVINFIGSILIIILVLFAIDRVNPGLLKDLPPVFHRIFDYIQGIMR